MKSRILLMLLFMLWGVAAFAANPSKVQCTAFTQAANVNTASVSFGVLPAVGHLVTITNTTYSPFSRDVRIADNQGGGNTYAKDVQKNSTDPTLQTSIFSTIVAASSGTFSITLNLNGSSSGNYYDFQACEWAGNQNSAVDKTGTNEALVGTSLTVTASGANSQNSTIVVAISQGVVYGGSPPTGYTELGKDTGMNFNSESDYKIINAGETSAITWTTGTTIVDAVGVLATYKGNSVSGACKGGLLLLGAAGC